MIRRFPSRSAASVLRRLAPLSASVMLLAGLTVAFPAGAALPWVAEAVLPDSALGGCVSLALDDLERPCFAAYNSDNDDPGVRYVAWDGADWSVEVVETETVYSGNGEDITLQLDSTGSPHILYDSGTQLRYARKVAGDWVVEIVDSDAAGRSSMTLDADDVPHVTYYHVLSAPPNSFQLRYGHRTGGAWQFSTIESNECFTGAPNVVVLDDDGHAHVAYLWNCGYVLYYATNASGSWVKTLVDGDINAPAGQIGLALDPAGWPAISYYHETNPPLPPFGLFLARLGGGGWGIEPVEVHSDASRAAGVQSTLAFDADGHPSIAYLALDAQARRRVHFARDLGSGWEFETADSVLDGDVGDRPSLRLDAAGNPYIVHYCSCPGHEQARYVHLAAPVGVPPTGPAVAAGLRVTPNPILQGSARIETRAGLAGPTRAVVVDLAGRTVATLPPPTASTLEWDGRNAGGARVRPGVYFVRVVRADGTSEASRVVVLR